VVQLVDVSDFSGRDPGLDFDVILRELKEFSASLLEKPMMVVASKIDACQNPSRIEAVRSRAEEHGLEFHPISSVTGTGIEELRYAISDRLFASEENARIAIGS
jgi:GTPase